MKQWGYVLASCTGEKTKKRKDAVFQITEVFLILRLPLLEFLFIYLFYYWAALRRMLGVVRTELPQGGKYRIYSYTVLFCLLYI